MFDNVACGQFGSVHAPRLCYCFSVCGGRKKEPLLRSCFITCNSLQMAGMEARCKSSAKKKGGEKKAYFHHHGRENFKCHFAFLCPLFLLKTESGVM